MTYIGMWNHLSHKHHIGVWQLSNNHQTQGFKPKMVCSWRILLISIEHPIEHLLIFLQIMLNRLRVV